MANTIEKYEIAECISDSKSSTIYAALNTLTNERVAIKSINVDLFELTTLANLKSEYDLLAKIKSEYVVKPFEYLKSGGGFFIVMEYCEGVSLLEHIREHKITVKEFLDIALKLAGGLADIHKAGIIHKNINPTNIIYNAKTGTIKILDLGISTGFSCEMPYELNPHSFGGTIEYISPEQTGRMNRSIDFRTDLYSLGITFYQLLSGRLPFTSDSPTELIYSHLAKKPPALHETNSAVPEVLSKIVAKLMSKMPEDRYANVAGIIYDLKICLDSMTPDGEIAEFALGGGDYTGRFETPKQLYGRESEVSQLLAAFANIVENGKELVAVGGYAGVGKTSLVNELHKPIVSTNGIFISGKFDQCQRKGPYHAFFQAIDQFCSYILSEPENKMAAWKTKLEEALAQDGKLLTDKVPRLELLAGKQQSLPEFSPLEERTRFKNVIQKLLMAISSSQHPLVMFIDDIHLADMGSFEVMEEIMLNDRIRSLLIIACYRNNEVDEAHPLLQSMMKIDKCYGKVTKMLLEGLAIEAATQMVADTFGSHKTDCVDLTGSVYNKTAGNPFYMIQFLKHCFAEGLIWFDADQKAWQWNLAAVRKCPAAENVVDFLIGEMLALPEETLKLIPIGACIGQSFGTDVLSHISGQAKQDIMAALKPAVSAEVIYPLQNKAWRAGETVFQFAHDRFQQACYMLLADNEKCGIHREIAMYHEGSGMPQGGDAEKLFVIAEHYAKAWQVIAPEDERRVAGILLQAAHEASLLSAFDTAGRFLEKIIAERAQPKGRDDGFMFAVYTEYHMVLFCLAKYDQADDIYRLLEKMAPDAVALTNACCLQAVSLSNRGRCKEAFMLGVALLEKMGVSYPQNDLREALNAVINEFYEKLGKDYFCGIEEQAETTGEKELAIQKILNRIASAAFFYDLTSDAWTVITCANRVLEHGYTPEGLQRFACLTVSLGSFRNDYRLPYHVAKKAVKLAEEKGYRHELYRMYHLFSVYTCHWGEDLINSIPYARESFKGNVETGDFEYACFTYFTTQQAILESCDSLEEFGAEATAALAFANKTGNRHGLGTYAGYLQFYKALKGETLYAGSFDDEQFNEQVHVGQFNRNPLVLCHFYIFRSLAAVLFGDFKTAYLLTEKAAPLMHFYAGLYPVALHNFVHSLSMCKRIENDDCTTEEKSGLRKKIKANQAWLRERANDAPVNFLHLYTLIEAEAKAIAREYSEANSLYEAAMDQAKANKRPYHYALICELIGCRMLKMKLKQAAAVYIREAYLAYLSLEATGKVRQMQEMYRESISSCAVGLNFDRAPVETNASGSPATANIDINSVFEAAQAISGEMELSSVLEKLIYVLMANAGAQDIYFLMKKGSDYEIQAEGHVEGNMTQILRGRIAGAGCVPLKIVDYVERTHESLILENAAGSGSYSDDEHITIRNAKSVLCMPVLSKRELKGILYLENNLVDGAFNKQRIDILRIIASQLAISLENTYFYNNLRESEERFAKVFNLSPEIIAITRMDGTFVDVNESFIRLTGYSREEVLGKSTLDMGIWDELKDRERLADELERCGEIRNMEVNFRCKDRGILQCMYSARLVNINDIHCILGVARDITEKRHDETCEAILHHISTQILGGVPLTAILSYLCEQLVSVFDLSLARIGWKMPDGTVRVDAEAGVQVGYCNQVTPRWDEEVDRICPIAFVLRTGQKLVLQTAEEMRDRQKQKTNRLDMDWENTKSCAAFPLLIQGKTVCGLGLVSRYERFWDERMLARLDNFAAQLAVAVDAAQKREQLNLLRAGLESAANMVGILDRDGNLEWVNPAYVKKSGYDYAELIGRNENSLAYSFSDLQHAEQTARQIGEAVMTEGVWHGELNLWRKDSSCFPSESTITAVTNDQGELVNFLTVHYDITERKQAQEAIAAAKEARVRAEKLFSLGTLSAGICHEINQPLNSIKMIASGISYTFESGKRREIGDIIPQIEEINRQTDRINNIVTQLRSMIRRGDVPTESCDINEAVEQSLQMVKTRLLNHGIHLETCLAKGLPRISASLTALEEVIINLLVNAMEALDTVDRTKKEIVLKTYFDDGVILLISDNGPGISGEAGQKIFEPFVSGKLEGDNLGLGLAIVNSLVTSFGGTISYESDGKTGTVFIVGFLAAEN